MKAKIKNLINDYRIKLERKERLLEPYITRKNQSLNADWCTEVEYGRYKALEAEVNLLKRTISDLKYVSEN